MRMAEQWEELRKKPKNSSVLCNEYSTRSSVLYNIISLFLEIESQFCGVLMFVAAVGLTYMREKEPKE